MRTRRHILIDWMERGLVAPEKWPAALVVAGVFPPGAAWRRFLDRLLLWLGALLLAAGVIFFFAYNWNDLPRMAKFALVEVLIVAALATVWRIGIEHLAGKVALLAAALFVGALLALVGQTYQTGADTFDLFAAWAALILPWVLVGRLAALWLLWLGLVNLATILYFSTFGNLFGLLFGTYQMFWVLFGIDTLALAAWELLARRSAGDRWAIRIVATASGALATALALYALVDAREADNLGLLAWAAYFVVAFFVYRRRIPDLFVLAGGVLSVIVVVTTWLATKLLDSGDAPGAFLFIGLVVIGLSAAGGWWLKRVAGEMQS